MPADIVHDRLTWELIETMERRHLDIVGRLQAVDVAQRDLVLAVNGAVGEARAITEKLGRIQLDMSEMKGRLGPAVERVEP